MTTPTDIPSQERSELRNVTDLEKTEACLEVEQARTRAEMHDDLDQSFVTLHERFDEPRVRVKLCRMGASDRIRAEAGHGLAVGRDTARRARSSLAEASR